MHRIHVDDHDALMTAVASLRAGELVVLPTDTVYGLAALPDDIEAVHKVFQVKDRPLHLNLPVLAASLDQVHQLGVAFSHAATTLASRWWPGPLTMAFGFSGPVDRPRWLAERDEVAVRIPDHPFLQALLERTGVLLVTSANLHGSATPPSADEAAGSLARHVSLIIDGGTLVTTPSTLVNVRALQPVVEREGTISRAAIAAALAEAS
jgi:L-threonylcarbamoyladenylate synthase